MFEYKQYNQFRLGLKPLVLKTLSLGMYSILELLRIP